MNFQTRDADDPEDTPPASPNDRRFQGLNRRVSSLSPTRRRTLKHRPWENEEENSKATCFDYCDVHAPVKQRFYLADMCCMQCEKLHLALGDRISETPEPMGEPMGVTTEGDEEGNDDKLKLALNVFQRGPRAGPTNGSGGVEGSDGPDGARGGGSGGSGGGGSGDGAAGASSGGGSDDSSDGGSGDGSKIGDRPTTDYDYPSAAALLVGKRTTPADLHSSMARAMRKSIILSVKRQLEVIARAKLSRFEPPTEAAVLSYAGDLLSRHAENLSVYIVAAVDNMEEPRSMKVGRSKPPTLAPNLTLNPHPQPYTLHQT